MPDKRRHRGPHRLGADVALKKLDDEGIVVSADSVILDNVGAWANLAGALVKTQIGAAWLVDLEWAAQYLPEGLNWEHQIGRPISPQ